MGKNKKSKDARSKEDSMVVKHFEGDNFVTEDNIVQNEDVPETPMETEDNIKVVKRRRKKQLYQEIRKQMEFYFSDANLRKDKFLIQLIEQDENSYVPVEVFLAFNKIRTLSTRLKDIVKACSISELLEVNEDSTMVKRKLPVIQKDNVDECTLYVERLPLTVDHSWIMAKFSQFGQILYISLPRFKSTDKIKGFAFVEFENPLSVLRACKFFKVIEKLNDDNQDAPKQKRKRGNSENEDEASRKRSRCNTDDSETAHDSKIIEEEVNTTEEPKTEMDVNEDSTTDKKSKKKRKRKKKTKVDTSEETPALRVMTKNEWKKWKNKYLSMQKAAMSEMKKSLLNENNIPRTLASPHKHQQHESNVKSEIEKPDSNKKGFAIELQKGVVVKLNISEPIEDGAEFRKNLKELGDVVYVDMNDESDVYVRCRNPSATDEFLTAVRKGLGTKAKKLDGEEEVKYWEKIHHDRDNKSRNRKSKKGNAKSPIKKKNSISQRISIEPTKSNKKIIFDENV